MKKRTLMVVFALVLIPVVLLYGCAREDVEKEPEQANKDDYIQIKGSDTEVNLVQHLAENFMEKSEVRLSVTGGGSGTGIAALINGEVDIANASREMKDSEIKQAEDNNVEPVRIIIAMDGLSIVVNDENAVTELTVDELARIYKGEIVNWQEVGGDDLEISLYGRQSNSGTYVYFRDEILKGDYTAEMKRMNGNAQIIEGIKTDKAGIGYVGVGYAIDEEGNQVEGLKIVNIARDEDSPAASPLKAENVENGDYPLARALNQYTDGKPEGNLFEFIKYELSEEGQNIAVEEGFYPVSPQFQEINKKNLDL